ncbi:MAG: TM0106 family RecB-like putative nuclease [Acidobacteria bacterium]|nr:TM0106 family RecB-like putative nuclease [Acidobacteriota bacterium]
MYVVSGRLRTSPTDLANFLVCPHKTALDADVARGRRTPPGWRDPATDVLALRGRDHERRYVAMLQREGRSVADLDGLERGEAEARLLAAMRAGVDVIVQAPLGGAGRFGCADALVRTAGTSAFGSWAYEVHDTKLARETRGGTILQLCVYTELLAALQDGTPEYFAVVTPASVERYRVADFAAFYRQVEREFLRRLEQIGIEEHGATGPWASSAIAAAPIAGSSGAAMRLSDVAYSGSSDAVCPDVREHCTVCRWGSECDAQRRTRDHLSFVAGLGRTHRIELAAHDVATLASLARLPLPIPFSPRRGAKDTYARLREQARLQLEQRTSGRPTYELLPPVPRAGLALLPEPSPGDLFLDLEGDPFAPRAVGAHQSDLGFLEPSTREYLFGLGRVGADGRFQYQSWWAFTDEEERAAFDAVLTEIARAIAEHAGAHVYHYAPYEPSAFRRLMGRHAWREPDVDALLRAGRFVDLYAVVRQAVRAGVERYSIKALEPCYEFVREMDLDRAGAERRAVEFAIETGDPAAIDADAKAIVEAYNRDDCRSTWALRQWLERLRTAAIRAGADIARPVPGNGDPAEHIAARDAWSAALRAALLHGLPPAHERTPEQHARWLVAHLADWFRREERVGWGEYHRLREQPDDELEDEPWALAGLEFRQRVFSPIGGRLRSGIDRYAYPPQECDFSVGDRLRLKQDEPFGTVHAIDRIAGTIDIKKPMSQVEVHPTSVIALTVVTAPEQEQSVYRAANVIAAHGLDDRDGDPLVNDLLLARPPRLRFGAFRPRPDELPTDFAIRTVRNLDHSVLAIQGPPGSGKTFTAARVIAALLAERKNVGVVATSHKVIRKLLRDVAAEAVRLNTSLAIAHKIGDESFGTDDEVREFKTNDEALDWIRDEGAGVLGGTAWMWARQDFARTVDVLVVDEAGQMSLATVVSVAQAGGNLVLLGDPRQLQQPQRGAHPDGVDVSALDHLLGGRQTIPDDRGIFLPITRRLAPAIAAFTSEVFYEGKLAALPTLERQRIDGSRRFDGAGLWVIEVDHDGCRNASSEEADVVAGIVDELLNGNVGWYTELGMRRPLTANDILIVAPYNAHVRCLRDRIRPPVGIGTVDRFQGQEAAVVIYSMAASRAEDAPRGMDFLFSPNRLNVASSRARCASILVACPRLFEPPCDTPRQMRLANALCRYREIAMASGHRIVHGAEAVEAAGDRIVG